MCKNYIYLLLILMVGCSKAEVAPPPAVVVQAASAPVSAPAAAVVAAPAAQAPPASRLPAAARVVAVGDVHGDLEAFRRALRLGGVIDASDRWIGAETVVVQTGDVLDRGDDEREIMELIARLEPEAAAAGGALVVLNGNHELMNAQLDLRYVTEGGAKDWEIAGAAPRSPLGARLPEALRGRAAAFEPGGPWALRLAGQNVVQVVGDSAFLHGGLEPRWAQVGPEAINGAIQGWLRGEAPEAPEAAVAQDGPVWSRRFSGEESAGVCEALGEALKTLGAKRMVVGHTVQQRGITSACEGRIWRIDTGMAKFYGGPTEVLEIRGEEVRVLGRD